MQTTMTVLCENTAGLSLRVVGEHGLSILVERGRERLLFDTGQGIGLLSNAAALGKDLSRVSRLTLSHGHYDHTGGLAALLDQTPRLTVFAHPDLFTERFARREVSGEKPRLRAIGIPFSREELEAKGAVFDLSSEPREILPGILASGQIRGPARREGRDRRLVVRSGSAFRPDPFLDDLSLVVDTRRGPVLLLGCAHAGLPAIVDHLRREAGIDRYFAVLGGTHLGAGGPPDWLEAVDILERYRVEKIGTSHCTGFRAASFLAARLGARVSPANAGTVLQF